MLKIIASYNTISELKNLYMKVFCIYVRRVKVIVWFIISCNSSEIMSGRLVSRRSLPVPLLTRVFLIYQQLSSLSRPSRDVRFSRARFMKWYFVQFHFSIRLDLLSWGKAGFRRHLIPKVSKNSYSAGTTLTGCLKSLVFEYKDIVILFIISNSFF